MNILSYTLDEFNALDFDTKIQVIGAVKAKTATVGTYTWQQLVAMTPNADQYFKSTPGWIIPAVAVVAVIGLILITRKS